MMMTSFLSCFAACLTCLTMVIHSPLLVSAQVGTPLTFPNGTKSLFIGNSLFSPFARQLHAFAKKKPDIFPDHNLTSYNQPGILGAPHEMWEREHYKQDVKDLLSSRDIELFGMSLGFYFDFDEKTWVEPLENIIHIFKRWINLALSYNPNTSIFLGLRWPNQPSTYESWDYMNKIQKVGDITYQEIILRLKKKYPKTNIFFLNYGSVAGAMNIIYDQGRLVDIDSKTMDERDPKSTKENSLFTDYTGHAGYMLKEMTALAWLNWLYVGEDYRTFAKTAKDEYNLRWDEKNVKEILPVVGVINDGYRL